MGDKLYVMVQAQTGDAFAAKITGMLLKMGDGKAQRCITDPQFLQEQIVLAKGLLNKQV